MRDDNSNRGPLFQQHGLLNEQNLSLRVQASVFIDFHAGIYQVLGTEINLLTDASTGIKFSIKS